MQWRVLSGVSQGAPVILALRRLMSGLLGGQPARALEGRGTCWGLAGRGRGEDAGKSEAGGPGHRIIIVKSPWALVQMLFQSSVKARGAVSPGGSRQQGHFPPPPPPPAQTDLSTMPISVHTPLPHATHTATKGEQERAHRPANTHGPHKQADAPPNTTGCAQPLP